MAIAQGRKGPAKGGVLDGEQATRLRALLAEHGQGALPSESGTVRGLARLTDLTTLEKESLPSLPGGDGAHLTVLVPACNEEDAIGATLRSLLGSVGLRLQIVAIDDRSTDRTG